jgi:hypothetical protein
MSNLELLRSRYAHLIGLIVEAEPTADTDKVSIALVCNGCQRFFPYPESDFTFWKIGPFGADLDFCPDCISRA